MELIARRVQRLTVIIDARAVIADEPGAAWLLEMTELAAIAARRRIDFADADDWIADFAQLAFPAHAAAAIGATNTAITGRITTGRGRSRDAGAVTDRHCRGHFSKDATP